MIKQKVELQNIETSLLINGKKVVLAYRPDLSHPTVELDQYFQEGYGDHFSLEFWLKDPNSRSHAPEDLAVLNRIFQMLFIQLMQGHDGYSISLLSLSKIPEIEKIEVRTHDWQTMDFEWYGF